MQFHSDVGETALIADVFQDGVEKSSWNTFETSTSWIQMVVRS